MRTPGHDFELAAGWLLTEGIVEDPEDITKLAYCLDRAVVEQQRYNIVTAHLKSRRAVDSSSRRNFYTSSACGVCGKASLDALELRGVWPVESSVTGISPECLLTLPAKLAAAQRQFQSTGGIHAAALFGTAGDIVCLREDVGRHNALDKVIGWPRCSAGFRCPNTS